MLHYTIFFRSIMSTSMLMDISTLSECVSTDDWIGASSCLADGLRNLTLVRESRDIPEILHDLVNVLHHAALILQEKLSSDVLNTITECFRFLRNASASQEGIQNILVETDIFNVTSRIIENLLNKDELTSDELICVKVGVQFIGNSVVGNADNQRVVLDVFSTQLSKILLTDDISLANCGSMVLYNILLGKVDRNSKNLINYLPQLLNCYQRSCEFAVFSVEYILQQDEILNDVYFELESDDRVKLLDAILSFLMNSDEGEGKFGEHNRIPLSSLLFLVEQLKKNSDNILKIVESGVSAEPRETLRLVDVIACASSRSPYLAAFQTDTSLLINVACLLKSVTDLGKIGEGNIFSSAQRLSEICYDHKNVQNHPVFGFKVSLVRLIGNLCHQHVHNQNQVRELGCLSAVLDACNIDAYNPLLLQWGVLAVRNLLENNCANQEIVAGLISQGPASSAVLHELGLELHQDDGGTIHMAPMKRT